MSSSILETYLQQSNDISSDLVFTPLPRWAIIERKVAIAVLIISCIVWPAEMIIRWRKGRLWLYRMEGVSYFRPNINATLPVTLTLFNIFFIIFLIGIIQRNDVTVPLRDWIPYFSAYNISYNNTLFLSAGFWCWNAVVSAAHAHKILLNQPSNARVARIESIRRSTIIQLLILITFLSSLASPSILTIILSIHHERSLDDFEFLHSSIQDEIENPTTQNSALLLIKLSSVFQHLEKEVKISLRLLKPIFALQLSLTLFLTIPYLCSIVFLFITLRKQRKHLHEAMERLKDLRAMNCSLESSSTPPCVTEIGLTGKGSKSLVKSTVIGVSQKFRKPSCENATVIAVGTDFLAKQQEDMVQKMQEFNKNYVNILFMNSLFIPSFIVFLVVIVIGFVAVIRSMSITIYDELFFHITFYGFIIPALIGGGYVLRDSIRETPILNIPKVVSEESLINLEDVFDRGRTFT